MQHPEFFLECCLLLCGLYQMFEIAFCHLIGFAVKGGVKSAIKNYIIICFVIVEEADEFFTIQYRHCIYSIVRHCF